MHIIEPFDIALNTPIRTLIVRFLRIFIKCTDFLCCRKLSEMCELGVNTIEPRLRVPDKKTHMSRPSQTKHVYAQTAPYGTYLCPDFREFKNFCAFFVRSKVPMSQTFARSKSHSTRISCVLNQNS